MSTIFGTQGSETLYGTSEDDAIFSGGGNDTIHGNAGDDTIVGYPGAPLQAGNTILYGDAGDDILYGGSGSDSLYGGEGIDFLDADEGNDILDGGEGNDVMLGGDGSDRYIVRDLGDEIYDSGGIDTAVVHVDFYKTNLAVENWIWADGVQRLPYWIDALLPEDASGFASLLDSSRTFYYSFPSTAPAHFSSEDRQGFTAFNEEQKAFARQAFIYISSIIDIRFAETSNPSGLNTIVLANNTQSGSAGYAYFPYDVAAGSDVFLDNTSPENLTPRDGDYSALTLIHEIGHALGLKHTFSQNDAIGTGSDGPFLPAAEESTRWSVMSYTDRPADYHLRYSPFDIAALQYLYGPSTATAANDIYTLHADTSNMIWDGGGNDTIDGSAIAQAITLYLDAGYWGYIGAQSSLISGAGQVTVNFGTVIENAKGGSASDTIAGNSADNRLWGQGGNDILRGGEGNDHIDGGAGNDAIDGGNGTDTAAFSGNRSGFTIMRTASGYAVSDAEGSDTLTGIECMAFSDAALDLEYNDAVQQLYVSYFGRAADATGYANFSATLASIDAPVDLQSIDVAYTTNGTIRALVDAFGTSAESNALYTGGTTEFITSIYRYLLSREPDAGGLGFWRDAIDFAGLTKGHAALSIMAGALANTSAQGQLDAALINNKIRVASNFTFALDTPQEVQGYAGDAAAAVARNMLANVSSSTDTNVFQSTVVSTVASLAKHPVASAIPDASYGVEVIGVSNNDAGYLMMA